MTSNMQKLLLGPRGGSSLLAATFLAIGLTTAAHAQQQPAPAPSGRPPNILVIFGDDIGVPQISAYTMGMMGYRTPNIDRIAREGAIFTDALRQGARRSFSARSLSARAFSQ